MARVDSTSGTTYIPIHVGGFWDQTVYMAGLDSVADFKYRGSD